jgi:hydroxymethylglutaryl-CoA lyase
VSGAAPDVVICEVGPRDGLQNEPETLATPVKRDLIERLVRAGLRRIEITSFVSPRWIPQLADADALASGIARAAGVSFSALVPNTQGYERFARAGTLDVAAVFVSASETHNRKNVNCSVAEQLERIDAIGSRAHADGVRVRAYVSTVCGCPYEGPIAQESVVDLCRRLSDLGADEISLGDTIGIGHPAQVRSLVEAVGDHLPLERVALHLHDTFGRALANLHAGYEVGIRSFDAALGGLGGCPYAPGASGNVATEDVVDLFERMGVATAVDLDALVAAAQWLQDDVLHRSLPGRVFRARQGMRQRVRDLAPGPTA